MSTFHLRRGVNWHEDVAVAAHDLKFTWDLPNVVWGA